MTSVLTIAGYDPSSGAGVTADLMVFAAHGLFGTSAVTALTVQSTMGVRSVHPVAAEILRETLDCLRSDLPPAGVKIGMLANVENATVARDYIAALRGLPGGHSIKVVLDPVLRSSSGRELLDRGGVKVLREGLLPLVDWVTPNVDELEVLTGLPVRDQDDLAAAAGALRDEVSRRHGRAVGVFAKGGHMETPDDFVLPPNGDGFWLRGERVHTRATHGTGCALASALLCELVIGRSAWDAATAAKDYVAGAMRKAELVGSGACTMNHLWTIAHS